jgi:ABC-type phosphate transport system permease subunit
MVSGLAVVLILIGGFLSVVGYQTISDCSRTVSYANCWNPFEEQNPQQDYSEGIAAFYAGAIMAVIGAVLVLGPLVGRRLGWGFAKGP